MFNDSQNDDAIQCDIDNTQIYRNYHKDRATLPSVGLKITLRGCSHTKTGQFGYLIGVQVATALCIGDFK